MCGIAGILAPDLTQGEIRALLSRMTNCMVHRGPDEEGFFSRAGVGLGVRRLSIIDIEHGQQPISNENGSIHVVSNGEIYNYRQLGSALRKQGHVFRTSSDTEAIVHLYEENRKECFQDLRGMFGTAIWDESRHRLVLARDRLGKKPLFYFHREDRLIFASEIKAILAAAPELAEIDEEALMFYFKFGFVCEPSTIFKQIQKLPAGHLLTYQSSQAKLIQYWKLPWPTSGESEDSHQNWTERLDELLQDSVGLRLESDVPLGIFLSGGLDSSSVFHYAHRAGLHPLKTFTIGFDQPHWDESKDARRIADHFQTEHHLLNLPEADMLCDLPGAISTLGPSLRRAFWGLLRPAHLFHLSSGSPSRHCHPGRGRAVRWLRLVQGFLFCRNTSSPSVVPGCTPVTRSHTIFRSLFAFEPSLFRT